MFKKIISICRVFFLGLIGIFSTFSFLVSYQPTYGFYFITEIPSVAIYSFLSMVSISFYFQIKWDVITYEFKTLSDEYLSWISKQKSFTVFLVSIPVNLVISLCQIGLIEIILRFTSYSIATASDISLFFVNVLNFFIIRTYVFRYEGKDYVRQAVLYTVISLIGLIINYQAVQVIVNNFYWVDNVLFGFPNIIAEIIGYKSTPQIITSALIGWVWFLCHKKITFRKRGNSTRIN